MWFFLAVAAQNFRKRVGAGNTAPITLEQLAESKFAPAYNGTPATIFLKKLQGTFLRTYLYFARAN